MTIQTQELARSFRYNSVDLPDPGIQYRPEEVRDFYAATYPEITTAAIEGPEEKDGKLVWTFRKAVGTKGAEALEILYRRWKRTAELSGWTVPPDGSRVADADWHCAWVNYWSAMQQYVARKAGDPDPGRPVPPHRSATSAPPLQFVKGSIARLRADRTTVPQLMNAAAQDPDPCSVFADGAGWHNASGAIIVVKGGAVAREIVEWLEARGFMTKPGTAALQAADGNKP
jgi:PRTRC genetic system protein C